ncbi:hypothetical protein SDC9_152512 [bioreactor metagenome]|uniref:Uncharacterized protein n=1 Tax=bioreactor metagenome TaxID=1076179 RepID=A0A645EVK6_9ZZZZ
MADVGGARPAAAEMHALDQHVGGRQRGSIDQVGRAVIARPHRDRRRQSQIAGDQTDERELAEITDGLGLRTARSHEAKLPNDRIRARQRLVDEVADEVGVLDAADLPQAGEHRQFRESGHRVDLIDDDPAVGGDERVDAGESLDFQCVEALGCQRAHLLFGGGR